MSTLKGADRESRRIFDWKVVLRMNRPPMYVFTAHRTVQDAVAGCRPIKSEQDARYAVHYRADYHIKTLIGENRYSSRTILHVDVSGAGYPFTEPVATVVQTGESTTPWSPHFASGIPVCNGTIWRSNGAVLLGHYLIHLAHLLNWDERLPSKYGGYNPEAVRWWRQNLNRPLVIGLRYPELAVDLLYGEVVVKNTGGFRVMSPAKPAKNQGRFRHIV